MFESEGTIGIALGGRRRESPWLYIRLVMIDEDVIRALYAQFGGSVQGPYSRSDRPNNRPFWQWTIGGRSGAELAKRMLPYLFARRTAQVEAVLDEVDPLWREQLALVE
jgi:hypothetical protein